MKKQLTALLLVLVMLFSAFALSACGDDKRDDPNGDNGDSEGSSAQYGSFKEAAMAAMPPMAEGTDPAYTFFMDAYLDSIDVALTQATKDFSLKKKNAVKKLYSAMAQDLIDMREVSYALPGEIVRSIVNSRTAKFIAGTGALTAEEIATVLCGIGGLVGVEQGDLNNTLKKLWADATDRACGQCTSPTYEALWHLLVAEAKLSTYYDSGDFALPTAPIEDEALPDYYQKNILPYLHNGTTSYPGDRSSTRKLLVEEIESYTAESVAKKDSALAEKASAAEDILDDFVSLYYTVQGIKDAQYVKADLATYLNAQVAAYKALIPDTQLAEFRTTDNVPAYLKSAATVMAGDLRKINLALTPDIFYAQIKVVGTLQAELGNENVIYKNLTDLMGVSTSDVLALYQNIGVNSMTAAVELLRTVLSTSDLAGKITEVSLSGADVAAWMDALGKAAQKLVDTFTDKDLDMIGKAFIHAASKDDGGWSQEETDRADQYRTKFTNAVKYIRDQKLLQKLVGAADATTYESILSLLNLSEDENANERLYQKFLIALGAVVGKWQQLLTGEDWDAVQSVISSLVKDGEMTYEYRDIIASDATLDSYRQARSIYEARYYGSSTASGSYDKSSVGYALLVVEELYYARNYELYNGLTALDLTIPNMAQLNTSENRYDEPSEETRKLVTALRESYQSKWKAAVDRDLPLFRAAFVGNTGFKKLGAATAGSAAFSAALAETNQALSAWRETDLLSLAANFAASLNEGITAYKEESARTQLYANAESISLTPGDALTTITVEKGQRRVFAYTPTKACTLFVEVVEGSGSHWWATAGGSRSYHSQLLYPGVPYYLVFASYSSNDAPVTFRVCLLENEQNMTLPEGITSIPYAMFKNNTTLTHITIPSSVTSISYAAFEGCTSLTSVTFENTAGWGRDVSDPAANAIYLRNGYSMYRYDD